MSLVCVLSADLDMCLRGETRSWPSRTSLPKGILKEWDSMEDMVGDLSPGPPTPCWTEGVKGLV